MSQARSLYVTIEEYEILKRLIGESAEFKLPAWDDLAETPASYGARGGRSRSEAKLRAIAENAKKGGRPKKYEISETPNGYVYKILATGEISNPFKTYGGARLAAVKACKNMVKGDDNGS